MKKTILAMLDDAAGLWPDEPYIMRKTDSGYAPTSFGETRRAARAFAAWLAAGGFSPDDKMAILGEGGPEWVEGEYGAFYAGLVSVPLSIKLTVDEILFRLDHSESRLILTTRNYLPKTLQVLERTANAAMTVVLLDEEGGKGKAAFAAWAAAHPARSTLRLALFETAAAEGAAALADSAGKAARTLEERAAAIGPDTVAMISYTSGTMSNPKGIMLTHLNLWTNSHDVFISFFTPRYRLYLMLPADHSFTHVCGIFTALWCCVSLWFVDGRGGGLAMLRNIPINMVESDPNFFFTVPAVASIFMKKIAATVEEKGRAVTALFNAGIEAGQRWIGDGYRRPSFAVRLKAFLPYHAAKLILFGTVRKKAFGKRIEFSVCGGSKADMRQQGFFAALGVPLLPGYGLTEASPVISSNLPSCCKYGTTGKPFPSVSCAIMDEAGNTLPPGEVGEITIVADSVMKGYYRNPEATAAVLKDGRLWTGDLGSMDEDGFLSVVGRARSLLVSESGGKYSPEIIEETVMSSTGIVDQIMVWCLYRKYSCALVGLDAARVKSLIAQKGIVSADELCRALQNEFYAFRGRPAAKAVQEKWEPRVFQIVEEPFSEKNGTINSTMKLVRRRAEEVYADLIEYSYTGEGSSTVNPRNIETLRRLFGLQ